MADHIPQSRVVEQFGNLVVGSTLWQFLIRAVQASDDRASAGAYPTHSWQYWDEAWDRYQTNLSHLTDEDRRLGTAYDLDDLKRCVWCLNKLRDPYLLDDEPYHPECADEARKEEQQ